MKYITYGKEKLYFFLDNYANNGALYIGLCTKDNELYADLTINIPEYLFYAWNEIIINGDISSDLVKKLEKAGILEPTGKLTRSGFGTYKIMEFNFEKAKDYIGANYSFLMEGE